MDLFINDQKIDFVLEQEETLGDVIHSVQSLVQESGGVISYIMLNHKSVDTQSDTWQSIPLPEIHTLEIEADTPKVAEIHALQSIYNYLDIIHYSLHEQKSNKNISEMINTFSLSDFNHIVECIDEMCYGHKPLHFPLAKLLSYAAQISGFDKEPPLFVFIDETIQILTYVMSMIKQRITSINNPEIYWQDVNKLIQSNIPVLTSIPTYISSSNTQLALHYLVNSIDLLNLWLHATYTPPQIYQDKISWQRKHADFTCTLQEQLKELTASVEMQDWVTISDIVEYEIIPRVEEYSQHIAQYYDTPDTVTQTP